MNTLLFKLRNISFYQMLIRCLHNHRVSNSKLVGILKIFVLFGNKLPDYKSANDYLNTLNSNVKNSAISKNTIYKSAYDLKIIVAAYNAERTIEACIDSIVEQKTRYSYIVEIIDDGSKDRTKDILERYKNVDNFAIITQKNKGFSGARNMGLKKLNTKYISFVDADDILEVDFIEKLLNRAFEKDADIVIGGYKKFNETGDISEFNYQSQDEINPYELYGYPWGKVYKSELFVNLIFPESYWFEDTMLIYLVYGQSKKVSSISEIIYNYRINDYGITAIAPTLMKSIDSLWITEQLLLDRKKLSLCNDIEIYKVTLRQCCTNYIRCRFLGNKVQKAIFVIQKEIINNFFDNFALQISDELSCLEKAIKSGDYLEFTVISYTLIL